MPENGRSVLVVEDDPEINELVGAYVQIAGFEYLSALNGTQAVEKAGQLQPALIVLDVMMPDFDGFGSRLDAVGMQHDLFLEELFKPINLHDDAVGGGLQGSEDKGAVRVGVAAPARYRRLCSGADCRPVARPGRWRADLPFSPWE